MKIESKHYCLDSQLSPEQIWRFLADVSFWTQAWQATTTTSSSDTSLKIQTQVKFAFAHIKIDITKTDQNPPSSVDFTVQFKSHTALFHYQIQATPTGSSLIFSVEQSHTSALAAWQRPLIDLLTKHHWQELRSTFHTFQHDQLFTQLQPEGSLITTQFIEAAPTTIGVTHTETSHSDSPVSETQQTSSSPLIFFIPSQPQLVSLPTTGFTLWRVATDWQRLTKKTFTEEKLTSTQWLVLYSLVELATEHPSLTGSQLAAATGLHKMVVSDLATELVKKHFLRKIKLPHNRKEYQLQATAAGKSAAFAAFAKLQQAEKQFFAQLPAETKSHLALISSM